jgi:protein required for attachment to host cells
MSGFPLTWILIADCGCSRLLSWNAADSDLIELESPTPDQSGVDNETFTNNLASFLRLALDEARYERLVLIAPTEFLVVLRGKLDHEVCQLVAELIGLDLTKASLADIRKRLPAFPDNG